MLRVMCQAKDLRSYPPVSPFWKPLSASRGFPARNEPVMVVHPDGMHPRSKGEFMRNKITHPHPDPLPSREREIRVLNFYTIAAFRQLLAAVFRDEKDILHSHDAFAGEGELGLQGDDVTGHEYGLAAA